MTLDISTGTCFHAADDRAALAASSKKLLRLARPRHRRDTAAKSAVKTTYATGCKSAGYAFVGSNPTSPTTFRIKCNNASYLGYH